MPEIPDKSVDLVITSPPYDNLRNYQGYLFNFEGIAKELFRIIKQGGVVVWVVGDSTIDGSETGTSFKQALYFKEIGFNLHDTMIYQKDGCSWPHDNKYHQCFEYMFIFSRGEPKSITLIEDRKNAQAGKIKKNRWERMKNGNMKQRKDEVLEIVDDGIRWNIWKYGVGFMKTTTDKIAFEHPAMFPEKLAADHIISWSNKGDLVLDPFNGSGTTTKMAKILGRNYIGVEISEKYCKIAQERLRQQILL
jgi:site-specific DNA-methyltransferase (adenine-specific)